MPYKDPDKARAQRRANYLKNKEEYLRRSRERRLRLQKSAAEEKSLARIGPQRPKHKDCEGCGADITFTYRPKAGPRCPSCIAKYMAEYRKTHAERLSQQKKAWSENNRDRKAAMDRAYAKAKPEVRRAARQGWEQRNRGLAAALKAQNKLARAQRVPSWLTEDDRWMIEQAYELAAKRTAVFGFPWHVDHKIPLKGRRVSGLHVPDNLQVLPAKDNLRKNNRFEVQ